MRNVKGLKVTVTGSFEGVNRHELNALLKMRGAVRTINVRKADILIVGALPGSRLRVAKEHGVECVKVSDVLNIKGE